MTGPSRGLFGLVRSTHEQEWHLETGTKQLIWIIFQAVKVPHSVSKFAHRTQVSGGVEQSSPHLYQHGKVVEEFTLPAKPPATHQITSSRMTNKAQQNVEIQHDDDMNPKQNQREKKVEDKEFSNLDLVIPEVQYNTLQ